MITCILTYPILSHEQVPKWTGLKLFAGPAFDKCEAIQIDNKNNYYITGTFQSVQDITDDSLEIDCKKIAPPQKNGTNGFLLRYDSARNLNLVLTIGSGLIGKTAVDTSGNIYVSGAISWGATRDGFIRKYSPAGNILWTKLVQSTIENSNADNVITSIDLFDDGSLVIAGFSYGDSVSFFGQLITGPLSFVGKLTPQGSVVWVTNFSSALGLGAYKVKVDNNGDILIAGNEQGNTANSVNAVIAKIAGSTRKLIWKKSFPSTGMVVPWIRCIGVYTNNYLFGGEFGGQLTVENNLLHSAGNVDIFLLQCDTSGKIKWLKSGGSPGRDKLYSLVSDPDGTSYVTGGFSDGFKLNQTTVKSKGNTDVFVFSIDSTANTLWVRTGGSEIPGHNGDLLYDEYGAGIALDSNNFVHVVGTVLGSGNFGPLTFKTPEDSRQNAFWLVLGDHDSTCTVHYPCTDTLRADTTFTLSVYPNPFVTSLTITNSHHNVINYEVVLYNMQGQNLDRKYFSGARMIIEEWNNLPAGMYFLKVKAGDAMETFKMVKQ